MKEAIKGYKFRIHPTQEQRIKIDRTFGACNYVYNGMLALRQFRYKEFGERLSKFDLGKVLTQVKIGDDWLKEFDSKALAKSIDNMDKAYESFFKGRGKFPKFKSKKNSKQSYTTRQIRIVDGKINLPKIGKVKVNCYDKHFENWYQESECTVSKSPRGRYYISILVKETIETYGQVNGKVGIDLGVKTFATTSDDEAYHMPKKLWSQEKRIEFLQKKLSRQQKGSARYEENRKQLAKHHERVTNIRKSFLHKLSTKLVKENQLIAIEDLNVKGMMKNRKLARAIGRMGFYQFRNILESKAKWHDREVVVIDRWFPSSKTCSCCGNIKQDLKLSDRTYRCKCGIEIDRDYNASINILVNAISLTVESNIETKN